MSCYFIAPFSAIQPSISILSNSKETGHLFSWYFDNPWIRQKDYFFRFVPTSESINNTRYPPSFGSSSINDNSFIYYLLVTRTLTRRPWPGRIHWYSNLFLPNIRMDSSCTFTFPWLCPLKPSRAFLDVEYASVSPVKRAVPLDDLYNTQREPAVWPGVCMIW